MPLETTKRVGVESHNIDMYSYPFLLALLPPSIHIYVHAHTHTNTQGYFMRDKQSPKTKLKYIHQEIPSIFLHTAKILSVVYTKYAHDR